MQSKALKYIQWQFPELKIVHKEFDNEGLKNIDGTLKQLACNVSEQENDLSTAIMGVKLYVFFNQQTL